MKYTHGVIIGKFLPPHLGHCFLIDVALRCSKTATLFLCSLDSENIAGELRMHWMKRLFPTLHIIHIDTARDEAERDNPRAVKIWAETISAHLATPADALFASESYGETLARLLKTHFVNVDSARKAVPISGNSIRSAPLRYWRYLPDVVRTYFVLPIVCSAPTVAEEEEIVSRLATHFSTTALLPPRNTPTLERADIRLSAYLHALTNVAYKCIFIGHRALKNTDVSVPSYYQAVRIDVSRARRRWEVALYAHKTAHRAHTRRAEGLFPILRRIVARQIDIR